jgi:hypothetical protein
LKDERKKNAVNKGIVSASYNCSGTDVECKKISLDYAENERKNGKANVNNHFLRDTTHPNWTKFQNPLYINGVGVPIVALPMISMAEAGLEKIVVVGNEAIGNILDAVSAFIKSKGMATDVTFINEGSILDLSRSNTIKKAKEGLGTLDNELVLEIAGDTGFLHVQSIINDPDCLRYDLIMNINVKEIAGPYFPRNYHWKLKDDEHIYSGKEPNFWLWDLEELFRETLFLDVVDSVYDARKAYSHGKKMDAVVIEAVFYENRKLNLNKVMNFLCNVSASELYCGAKYTLYKKMGWLNNDGPHLKFSSRSLEKIAQNALGAKTAVRIKPCAQPGGLPDIDSKQDNIFIQASLDINPKIYPHLEELIALGKYTGGKWDCEYTDNFKDFANNDFKEYGINAEYRKNGTIKQKLFSEDQIRGQIELMLAYLDAAQETKNRQANQDLLNYNTA